MAAKRDALHELELAKLPSASELITALSRELERHSGGTRRGRPEKLDAATVRIITRCIERGLTIDTTAHVAGIHPDTLRRWKREYKALGQLIDHHRAKGKMFVVSKGFDAVSRGDVGMIKFWLSRQVEGFQSPAVMDRTGRGEQDDTPQVVGFDYEIDDLNSPRDAERRDTEDE